MRILGRPTMRPAKLVAAILLCLVAFGALAAGWLRPAGFAEQLRGMPAASPSLRFPLGTDDLGRDLLARTLYGMRLSLALAGTAALVATALAALVGIAAGYAGGAFECTLEMATNLLMALPWLFLLMLVRAMLPVDMPPEQTAWVTFLLLALLGWAPASRVLAASTRSLRLSAFVTRARAEGAGPIRLLYRQLAPNLCGLLWAQFLILLPGFVLSEATLGFLGLGVAEPLPSWGALLRDLEDYSAVAEQPWRLAPLILMFVTVLSLEILAPKEATK
jgi:ABC-type dipeptide/oligopeptide/nickel transport system permease subunit